MVAESSHLESSHSFLLIPQQGRGQQEASGPVALQEPQSHSQEGKPHFTPPSLSPCRSTIKTIWSNVLMSGLRVAAG